jgi:sterol desaturase/sphingolipid hydroxylase (fatty acid hydroxylase superfamily)
VKDVVNYFGHLPDAVRIYLLFFSIGIGALLDLWMGFAEVKGFNKHFLLNARFVITATPIQVIFSFLLIYVFSVQQHQSIGLYYYTPDWGHWKESPMFVLIFTLVFLDFFEYIYHVIMHQFKRTWMFHAIHHCDMNLDSSTTLREHPGETAIRMLFLVVVVGIGGVPFWAFIFRQCIQIIFNVVAHSTLRLPRKLDQLISLIFITPNVHQVHHHFQEPWTNTNYGDILSIWDRMFGTYQSVSTHQELLKNRKQKNFGN